jgi:PAS domain S-box-containing protein
MTREPNYSEQEPTLENERLRSALAAARVGSWDFNLVTRQVQWSPICKQLFGLPANAEVTATILLEQVHPDDRQRVALANAQALDPLNHQEHNIVFRTLNPEGNLCWVQARGKTFRDDTGQLIRFSGIVQDVTQQVVTRREVEESEERYRTLSAQLEQQVFQRTHELTIMNEEYAAANEELEETNQRLMRSNQNLEQFAYIASHDLQEPLRKIQSFGDLLKNNFASQLGAGVDAVERMQSAAGRMSLLIKDLLSYSRISTQQSALDWVSLTDVVKTVLTDLELIIHETGAKVTIETLPRLKGDRSQLGQLFQNLLSNALKFRRAHNVPIIHVGIQTVLAKKLPPTVRPGRKTLVYHCISVTDNGIGFDEKYLTRIFQVFQRLHAKKEFAGSGIGLAICEKVVLNHGGAITAMSQPGKGSTFHIYLPNEKANSI